jgi:hypothetical protein
MTGQHIGHPFLLLHLPGHQQQLGRPQQRAVLAINGRTDNDVNQARFCLQRQEVKAFGRRRRLVYHQQPGHAHPPAVGAGGDAHH